MDLAHWLLVFAAIVVLYVVGEIWFAQIVIYPLFAKVGEAEYVAYHRFYSGRIPLPVIIPGFASFFLPVLLMFVRPESVPLWLAAANAAFAIVGLLVTVVFEIPRHRRLEQHGKNERTIWELTRYNWPRTLSITSCGFLTTAMLLSAFAPI